MIVLLREFFCGEGGKKSSKPPFGTLTKGRLTAMRLCNDYIYGYGVTLRLGQCGMWTGIIMPIIIRHMHIVVVCVILFVAALLSELLLSILREESMYSPQLVTAKVDNRFYIAKYLQNNPLLPPWATPKGVAPSGRGAKTASRPRIYRPFRGLRRAGLECSGEYI